MGFVVVSRTTFMMHCSCTHQQACLTCDSKQAVSSHFLIWPERVLQPSVVHTPDNARHLPQAPGVKVFLHIVESSLAHWPGYDWQLQMVCFEPCTIDKALIEYRVNDR